MKYFETSLESRRILARNIEDYLALTKSSMDDLADKAKCSRQQIHKIKNSAVNPSLDFLDTLAKATGCSVQDLFTEGYFSQFKTSVVKKRNI